MTVLRERQAWKRERKPKALEPLDRLTAEESAHVRAVLGVLRVRMGSLANVAKAMRTHPKTIVRAASGQGQPSAGMAIKAAKLAGVSVDDVLSGEFPKAGSCPMCGRSG